MPQQTPENFYATRMLYWSIRWALEAWDWSDEHAALLNQMAAALWMDIGSVKAPEPDWAKSEAREREHWGETD